MCRSSPTDRRTMSQRSTFPCPPRSFARQLIYRRALELYAAARHHAAFTNDDDYGAAVLLLSARRDFDTPATPIVFTSNREYRAYISICVTTRSMARLHDPSPCRFIAVVTTSPGNVRRLQKSIAIGDTRTSTRANDRFLLALVIARTHNYSSNF